MTERCSGYVITMAHDIREDDAEQVINALRLIRGVVDVRPVVADEVASSIAESRARVELANKLLDLHREVLSR